MSNEQETLNRENGRFCCGCIAALAAVLAALFMIAILSAAWNSSTAPTVRITDARIMDTVTADGQIAQAIYVDFENTGRSVVKTVVADVTAYDSSGQIVFSYPERVVYASETGVQPGRTYSAAGEMKTVIPPVYGQRPATRAEARLVMAKKN